MLDTKMRRRGRAGFTLVELLIVVVVIGVLAAIAVARYDRVKVRAHVSTTQSDLKNVSTKQEMYHMANFVYAPDLTTLDYQTSPGITITVTESTGSGWAAVATHAADASIQCGLYVGTAAQANAVPATRQEVIACSP